MSKLKELRDADETVVEERLRERFDNASKRIFGSYVDQIDETIDSIQSGIEEFESMLAFCDTDAHEVDCFEAYVSDVMSLEQLKKQSEESKKIYEKLFGEKFRQVV